MIRWRLVAAVGLGVLIGIYAGDWLHAAGGPYTLAVGRVTANDQEKDGCMFAFGYHAMLMLHTSGEPCKLALGLVGRTGRLMFVLDE